MSQIQKSIDVDDHQVSRDLDRFKEFIEGRGQASGAWRAGVDAG